MSQVSAGTCPLMSVIMNTPKRPRKDQVTVASLHWTKCLNFPLELAHCCPWSWSRLKDRNQRFVHHLTSPEYSLCIGYNPIHTLYIMIQVTQEPWYNQPGCHACTDDYLVHDDVIKWKHFPRYWPFVRGIHRSPWIPFTKANDAKFWCFLWYAPE